jgi:hypothetical protein
LDLTDEAGRASTRRADSARGFLSAAAIADLAGTDTKVVFVARHQATIGSRTLSRKTRNAVRAMQRGNTCAGEDTAISDFHHVAGAGSRSIEREWQSEKAPLAHLGGTSETDLKQCAGKNLGTKFRKRGNPLYLAIKSSYPRLAVFRIRTTDGPRKPTIWRRRSWRPDRTDLTYEQIAWLWHERR